MANLLKGKPIASTIKDNIAKRVNDLRNKGVEPTLAILRVGEKQDDLTYESSILKMANLLGINVNVFAQEISIQNDELLSLVEEINNDDSIHGCLIFRPLPKGVDEMGVCDRLDTRKDIDCCAASSLADVFMNQSEGFAPATAEACIRMLDYNDIEVAGKKVVVIGRSLVIGKPVSMLALNRDATVTICHSKTPDLESITKSADIVICATGKPKAFDDRFFSSGQTVIDVGMNVDENGLLCGDVDIDSVSSVVQNISPVPGGVGGITTAVLLEHVILACERICQSS